MSQGQIYRCSPSVVWVRDADQTLVVDRETGRSWTLCGAEAVVWDLLAVGYAYQKIITMLSLILSLSVEEAKHTLIDMLREWQDAKIIWDSGEADDGELDCQCSM